MTYSVFPVRRGLLLPASTTTVIEAEGPQDAAEKAAAQLGDCDVAPGGVQALLVSDGRRTTAWEVFRGRASRTYGGGD